MTLENSQNIGKSDGRAAGLTAARELHAAGRDREAMDGYRLLLAALRGNGEILREAGQLADALGADALAIQWLSEAVESSESDDVAAAALALAHMHAGRAATAGRCWWRLCRRNVCQVDALAGLLVCALASGHTRVVAYAQRALAIHASRLERQKALARMWQHAAGGMVIARRVSRKLRRPAAGKSPLTALLAHAVASLEQQTGQYPRRADAHYHLAACREALGRVDQAAHAVERALAINPRYAAAGKLAGRLRSRSGAA